MAANALSAPPKCRHFPWQRSLSTRLCWNALDHDFKVLAHIPWGPSLIALKRWTSEEFGVHHNSNEYCILYANWEPERPIMFLAYVAKEAPKMTYTCLSALTLLFCPLCDRQYLLRFPHFPMDDKRRCISCCNPWPFRFDCVMCCSLVSLPKLSNGPLVLHLEALPHLMFREVAHPYLKKKKHISKTKCPSDNPNVKTTWSQLRSLAESKHPSWDILTMLVKWNSLSRYLMNVCGSRIVK